MDIQEVSEYHQGTYGSLVYRGWAKRNGKKVEVTAKGREDFALYGSADVMRKNFHAALSKYIRNGNYTK